MAVAPLAAAAAMQVTIPPCVERPKSDGRTCADCMSRDHGGSGQALLMCVQAGYDCKCNTPNTSVPHRRILQRGLDRAAWKSGNDAHLAFQRLLSHKIYAPSVLRESPAAERGGGSWIVQFDNFTTPDESRELIEAAGRSGWSRGNGGKTAADRATRTNDVAWCHGNCFNHPVVNRVIRKIEQVTGVGRVHYEAMQLLRYRPGEFFRRHHDSYDGSFGAQLMGHRILTAFMYLNDVPEEKSQLDSL